MRQLMFLGVLLMIPIIVFCGGSDRSILSAKNSFVFTAFYLLEYFLLLLSESFFLFWFAIILFAIAAKFISGIICSLLLLIFPIIFTIISFSERPAEYNPFGRIIKRGSISDGYKSIRLTVVNHFKSLL